MMIVFVYVSLIGILYSNGEQIEDSCVYSILKYKYESFANFRYIPRNIVNQTSINVSTDVFYYQSNTLCNRTFIRLENLIVHPNENIQLEKSIQQLFNQIDMNSIVSSVDYQFNSFSFRRIQTFQTSHGYFHGNSILANFLLNKLIPSTKINCELIINLTNHRLENHRCNSTTAGLVIVHRQLKFIEQISNSNEQNFIYNQTKIDFKSLLKDFCSNSNENLRDQLIDILTNQKIDLNLTDYSTCRIKLLKEILIHIPRSQSTKSILEHFYSDSILVNYHFDLLDNPSKEIFNKYFLDSCQIIDLITFRMLAFLSNDNLTINCIRNQTNPWLYRSMAIEIIEQTDYFIEDLRQLINNENEFTQIRILAFEKLSSHYNSLELIRLIQTIQSKQFRFYLQSFSKQSSLWLAQSGSYEFPFGKMNIIFPDDSFSIIPYIIHIRLTSNLRIDFYRNINSEILIIINRKIFAEFKSIEQILQWIRYQRIFQIPTLDGFMLKIKIRTQFFSISSAKIQLRVEHSLDNLMTGYEILLNINSNFRISIEENSHSKSYIWRANQNENILLQFEQVLRPLVNNQISSINNSSSNKDFCYIIPHFDSKLCLSFIFERLWPSSISLRLLADDPSLIYNLTSTKTSLQFHIQQNEQIFRSYEFHRRLSSFEFFTPTSNYLLSIHWNNSKDFYFNLLKNNQILTNGSGLFQMKSMKNISIYLKNIFPQHIGDIQIDYNGNLTINASKFLAGKFLIEFNQIHQWNSMEIKIFAERIFFFFKQTYFLYFDYNLINKSLNLTFIHNNYSQFQWTTKLNRTYFNQNFLLNTSLFEINQDIQGYYFNLSNMNISSKLIVNGWTVWNLTGAIDNWQRIQIQLNRLLTNFQIQNRTMNIKIEYLNKKLIEIYSNINQFDNILIQLNIPGYAYQTNGRLLANYTNYSLDFPIFENSKQTSHIHFDLICLSNNLILNLTSSFPNQSYLKLIQNLTFKNQFLFQLNHTFNSHLISFNLILNYLENSTEIQILNGSFHLPNLFVSKAFYFYYKKNSKIFLQLFNWANFTQIERNSHLQTSFGFQLFIKNNLPAKISFQFEQKILNKSFIFLIEIDRNWMISLILNQKFRYEFITSPIDSIFLIRQINLLTNQTRLLPIYYFSDSQTLLHIEIRFSKYFTRFMNDFLLDFSLKNHTLKLSLFIPLFKREFFSFIWFRFIQKELFHFSGLIQMKILHKRHLIDYNYNLNLASIRFWTLNSKLSLFSSKPIQWNLNLTNDYLWNGQWTIDFQLISNQQQELIHLHHQYTYTILISNLIFQLNLLQTKYDLDFNYYHLNQSINGLWKKNLELHRITGKWNSTESSLYLNTKYMKSKTILQSKLIKILIEKFQEKIGFLFQRTRINHSDILECNPYLIIQSTARLFEINYYTINDGLMKMMFEWSTRSYLSWNYTNNGRIILPLKKFEIDTRKNYILRFHTNTFRYSFIYNHQKRQLTIRRLPFDEYAEDIFDLKICLHLNQTLTINLQIINNYYRIFAYPNDEKTFWFINGTFRYDHFQGFLNISKNDWLLSSIFEFNSTFHIATGRYVQFLPTNKSQLALEIYLKSRFHLIFQYAGLHSLIGWKLFHNSSKIDLIFSSQSINSTSYQINFQLNQQINQIWILNIENNRFDLSNNNQEFQFNGSLNDFSFLHSLEQEKTFFFLDDNTILFKTNTFGIRLSNLSSETRKDLEIFHQKSKQNLTIHYYKYGEFRRKNFNIQIPIYDIEIIYYLNTNENRFVKFLFEFVPLQMSTFSFVRGRTFRIGYQTKSKQCFLEGNLAFGLDDIENKNLLIMTERWKFIYGFEKYQRLFIKWNLKINLQENIARGNIQILDPNGQMSKIISTDINTQLNDMIFLINTRTLYGSSKPIIFQINLDRNFFTRQYIFLNLIHEYSQTNLSLTIDHYPQRKFLIRYKSNQLLNEQTLFHFYGNTTNSQLKLFIELQQFIHWNLSLPISYPESGILQSTFIVDNQEYFYGRFDPSILKLHFREYIMNISLNQLIVKTKIDEQILAYILFENLQTNSSANLITFFSQTNFPKFSIQITNETTWLDRFQSFLLKNDHIEKFFIDIKQFLSQFQLDFIHEQGQFANQLIDHLKFDDDLQSIFEQFNLTTQNFIEKFFDYAFLTENYFEEYFNNLTCLSHHQNLFHLNISQLSTLTINTLIYETISHINQSLIMFEYFQRYPHSINAILTYLTEKIHLNLYKFMNNFILETKEYFLSNSIRQLEQFDILMRLSPIYFDSITYFSSTDIQIFAHLLNNRLREFLLLWKNSPIEYKFMKTISSLWIEFIDRLRFYLDDKLDFLLPTLKIYSPKMITNHTVNQTFLLTWSKQKT